MIRFLRSWLRGDEPQGVLRQQLDAFAATDAFAHDAPEKPEHAARIMPPRTIYAERDRSMTHETTSGDVLANELRREREQGRAKVRSIRVGKVQS